MCSGHFSIHSSSTTTGCLALVISDPQVVGADASTEPVVPFDLGSNFFDRRLRRMCSVGFSDLLTDDQSGTGEQTLAAAGQFEEVFEQEQALVVHVDGIALVVPGEAE